MKRFLSAIAAALMLLAATDASAVTQKEMEQARTATARIFLRNANNGADYLDNINATTMSELESKLHQKEKENLKTFNSVAMPRDYAGWDKDKLVTYWSETFYSQPAISGAIKSLGFAKKQTKTTLGKMTVSAATAATETPADAAEPDQQPATGIEQPFADADDPVAAKQDEEARLQATADSIAALQAEGADAAKESGDDGSTWIYVGVLCVLVALVVALIIYATRTSKKNKGSRDDEEEQDTEEVAIRENSRDSRRDNVRENIRDSIRESRRESMHDSRMEEELRSLTAENAELRRAVEDYKFHLNSLKAELEAEKRRVTMLRTERAAGNAQPAGRERVVQPEPVAAAPRVKGTPERLRRNIFLGRANRDGIFLRAEREVNLDQSLFRLVSNDGVTGTFTVIEEPEVEARIIADPDTTLAYSCILTDRDTFGRESVVTERPGTAVFESGRWRVLRKAQVKLV